MTEEKAVSDDLQKNIDQLTAELNQRNEELAVINSVQEGLARKLDMQSIYDLVGDRIRDTFDAQGVIIATFDLEGGTEHFGYAIEKGERFHLKPREFDKLRQSLIDSKQKILINENFEEAYRQFGMRVLPGSDFPKSAVYVPLVIDDNVRGYVSLQNVDKENAFSDSDVRLLETLANSMSNALENARLLKETEQRTAELAVINSVQEALAKEMDIQAIYDLVGNRIRELFDAQVVGIATFDHKAETEQIHYLIEKGERYYPAPRPLNILRKHLIATREKILINKNFDDVAATFGMKKVPGTEQPKSALYVPLVIGERVTGYMSLQNIDKENAFSDSDVRLMETLANSMGVALENARLFDETTRLLKETEQQKAELGVINSVQEGLAKELDMQAIYDLVGNRIRELFDAQAVMIANFDHDAATEHFKYVIEDGQRFYLPPRPYDKLRQHLIVSAQKIVINTNFEEAYARFGLRTVPGTNPTKSGVFVPLIIGDKVNSYISLQNMKTENAFSESDVRLLETLANSMSVALENARLFDETTRLLKETEQRTAELAVINSVQEGLARELDMKAIYDLVGNKVRDVFDAQVVMIATFDQDTGKERFNYLIEKGERYYPEPRPYDKLRYQLIMTKQKILINNNVEKAFEEFGLKVVKGTDMPKSILFVPLVVGNKVTSYVSLQNVDKESAFSDSDVRLLETLANSMSVALENARLFDETNRLLKETEQGKAELAVINSVQEGLAHELDIHGIYKLVGDRVQKLFNAQVVIIAAFDHERRLEYFNYHVEKGEISFPEPRPYDKVRKHLIETGQNILINENSDEAIAEFGLRVVPGTEMPKSMLFMPLKVGEKVTGYVSLQNIDQENAFSYSDVRLLSTLANSMSVALENARLFDETNRLLKETEQRTAELSVINSVQDGLAKEVEMRGIYELVGEKIRNIFNAQVVDIATYDKNTDTLQDRYSFEKGDRSLAGTWKPAGFRRMVIDSGQLLLINEDLANKAKEHSSNVLLGEQPKSAVFVPLISRNEIKGMISLQNLDKEHAFSENDVNLLTTLANSMSVALESATRFDETVRLLKETEQRTAELSVINSVQDGLAKEIEIQGIYELVGEKIREIFSAQVVDIVTYDSKTDLIEDRYAYEKGDRTLVGKWKPAGFRRIVIDTGQLLLINDDLERKAQQHSSSVIRGEQPKSAVFVPLISRNEVKGMISLQNLDKENAFSENDVSLLTTLANSMSVALESARRFDETNRLLRETEQRNAELAVINSVQESLVAKMDMQGIYELVGEKIREIFDAQVIDIVIYDPKANLIEDRYAYEKGDRTMLGPREVKGFRKHVIETKQLLLHNEKVERAMREFGNEILIGEIPKSQVYVPMITGNEVKGVISLQNLDHEHAFTNSDTSLLTTLANSMSVALESARLFDETNRLLKETEQRTAELSVINSVQEGLAKELDIQGIYELVGEKMRGIFNAQVIDIVTHDKRTQLIEDRYTYEKGDRTLLGPRPLKGFRKYVFDTGKPLVINRDLDEQREKYDQTVIVGKGAKSIVLVPLIASGEINGVISLQNLDQEYAFPDSDVNLLTTLANSMSVALENARLFDETNRLLKETEQRTAELAVINSVQEGLAKELDIDAIYTMVGERIRHLFDAQVVGIATLNPEEGTEKFQYFVEKGQRFYPAPRPLGKLRLHLIQSRKKIVVNKIEEAEAWFGTEVIPGTEMIKSAVFVPLMIGDKITSYVTLQNIDKENAFTDAHVRLLETLANSMSVALENARLFDETNRLLKETEQRTSELAVINSVQEGLVAQMDMNSIYELVGEKIRKIFKSQVVDIVTYDRSKNLIEDKYSYEKGDRTLVKARAPKGFRKHVIETGELLVHNNNVEQAMRDFGNEILIGEMPKSQIYVPMIAGGEVKGVVSLQNLDHENAFSRSDISLLTTLANSMSVALENARLFDETNRLLKETEQRTAELGIINSVQEGLVREMNIGGIYKLVGDRLCSIFPDTQALVIRTFDHEAGLEHFHYAVENDERLEVKPQPFIWESKQLIATKKALDIEENYEAIAMQNGEAPVTEGLPVKSAVFVPMVVGDVVKGSISLQNVEREHAFNESDLRLLTTLSNSMSVALENARLFDETNRLLKETEQRTAELGIINSVQEGLASKLDIQSIYDLVGDKIRDVFDTQGISISYYDKGRNFITHPYYLFKGKRIVELGFELGKGLTSHIINTAQPLLINENAGERFKELGAVFASSETEEDTAKSWLGVPLISGGQVNGTIRLENYERENAYTESDVSLLQTLANSMSVALENARLFDETNRLLKETEQRTAELAVINSVQEGLAKELDMQGIYNLVGDRIQTLFQTHAVIIASFDLPNRLEHFNYFLEYAQKYEPHSRPIGKLRQLLIDKKQTIFIETEEKAKKEYGITAIGETKMPKSLMFVPLLSGNNIKGYVSIQNVEKDNAFNESDVRLLETLANSMSVALENARLFHETNRLLKETEQRTAELAVINSVQEGLAKELDVQGIYEMVGDRLCSLFPDTQTLVIRTFDYEKGTEHFQYAIEKGERFPIEARSFNWTSKELMANKKSLDIRENYLETAKSHGGTGVTKGQPPKAAVFVPMLVGDLVKGSVSIQNVDKEHAFTDADVRLLTTITNSMSVAVENARLFDETTHLLSEAKQRASELSTVNSISKALASELDPDDLIKFVGDKLKDLFRANIVYLALLNPKTKMIHFPYQFGDDNKPMKLGEGLTSKIILSGEPLLINKDVQELRTKLGVQRQGIPAASYLGVPIPVGDEIIGVLSVQSTEHENSFNENDLRLLSTIAASVGVALRNATLFEDVKMAKMEAEAATKAAEKANEAKSAFLSTVSHELRTPLTSVLGFAKIIRKRLDEKIFPTVDRSDTKTEKTVTQISENLEVVISEGERLTHLINDVLDLAKIEAGKMEWSMEDVSMTEVAERALAATTALFDQKKLKLVREIEADIPDISGDRDKLIQVIINLISNAVKFTDKGSVTCKVHRGDEEIIVSVTDTGIGIAPEDYAAVFEQFKQVGGDTLTDKPKGTGLGLPICKEIVEHHGGRIWLESVIGKGSTFSFSLPIVKSKKEKPLHLDDLVKQLKEQMAHSKFKVVGKDATILVVDDDDSIRSLLQQELSDAGYLIEQATNGKEALESVRKNRPDLIILDVMMPEMNGFDVAAVLKNDPQTMDIPIIVLSIVQDKARGYRIGVDRYLTKPIDTTQLFKEVGALLEQGKSKKKVMVVDEEGTTVRSLTEVLQAKGYQVVETDGKELVQKAISAQPDIIILNSVLSDKQEIVQSLRFEKGLENVLFLIYQ